MLRLKTIICSILMIALIVGVSVLGCGIARADQPHMQAALAALREARHELEVAERNKGGHRERALEHVEKAIAQVEEGIAHGRR